MDLVKATWAKRVKLSETLSGLAPKEFDAPVTMAKTGGRIKGEALVSNPDLGGDLMFVPGGSGFEPHTHHGHHLIFVISGECTVTLGAEIHRLLAGEVCLIPGEIAHAVTGVTDTMLLAVGTPHMPVDAEDRLDLVTFEALTAELSSRIRCMGCSAHRLFDRDEILGEDGVVRCPKMLSDGKCQLVEN
jgi:quercetin dioxygenase-like cupin family protein